MRISDWSSDVCSSDLPGKAVRARIRDGFLSVGSPRYAAEQAEVPAPVAARIDELEAAGKTVVVVMQDKRILGLVALRDEPREDAARGIATLAALGIRAVMLTGDNARTATAIAGGLGLAAKAGRSEEH